MKVALRYIRAGSWRDEEVTMIIEGCPNKVDAAVKAIREEAKKWDYWEEK